MNPESKNPVEAAPPVVEEAQAALRDGMERAHELVSEAKLAMRQLKQPAPPRSE